ncbi:MAG: pantoate--beta-alanine ligase [Myxococcales bacterium]|nr:pantoate--beta-alanine ligase [Myxococcales bacterium]
MSVRVIHALEEFRAACDDVRRGGRLGLVPTMGALHRGHLRLVERARELTDVVAVTIFVNPTQFGANEDLDRYPRDLSGDVAKCESAGASLVFAPDVAAMYPPGERTRVRVSGLTEALCGESRPTHFEGVTTIVTKLFAVAGPCTAVFGRKDYQQLKVIERMTRDLLLPVQVVGERTVREADGLALSSRNAYLSEEQRESALGIARGLSSAVRAHRRGERSVGVLVAMVEERLRGAGLEKDYVTLADAETIATLSTKESCPDRALLAVAARCGHTRLIDNVVLGEDPAPIAEEA